MKYAIVQIGGKQLKIEENKEFTVNLVLEADKKKQTFAEVLMIVDGDKQTFGAPLIKDAKVTFEVIEQTHLPKIRVATYKAKSRSRKVYGHKQPVSVIKVLTISA